MIGPRVLTSVHVPVPRVKVETFRMSLRSFAIGNDGPIGIGIVLDIFQYWNLHILI